ncbi:MAG: DUF2330 domain-containing protein, partial [Archangiaceae bacterium]|nr:DUF2330 domain-containing protein [Archangiaceae bacterium]
NKYKIPEGAEPLFRPYVQQGLKFFVAKVNSKKVTFEKGMAKLSPLRFHYDAATRFVTRGRARSSARTRCTGAGAGRHRARRRLE